MNKLPFVKTKACEDCGSEKYLECPICSIYRCECYFNHCELCNIKHCFCSDYIIDDTGDVIDKSNCGEIEYLHDPEEMNIFYDFDYDYEPPPNNKTFHCKIRKIKCNSCDYKDWINSFCFTECDICDELVCEKCIKPCKAFNCYKWLCNNHEMKLCTCGEYLCTDCSTEDCLNCYSDKMTVDY